MENTPAREAARAGVLAPLSLSWRQWWRVLMNVREAADRATLPLIAGGVAFFGLMAAIPAIAALVAIVGVFGQPGWVADQIAVLDDFAPEPVVQIIQDQATRLLAARQDQLVAGAVFNLALAMWSAMQGARWMLLAVSAVNRHAKRRGFFRRMAAAGGLTLFGLGLGSLAVGILGAVPLAMALVPLAAPMQESILFLRWPVLLGVTVVGAGALYRWGPSPGPTPWRWVWPGAIAAPLVWFAASAALRAALHAFPSFGAAYGSLASVVALLLWLYLTAYVFLLGAALNAELQAFVDDLDDDTAP
jgi:membrane protein